MKTHSGTCLIPGRKLEGTVPHKLLRGEHGLPCTAGSQSSGDLCRRYSSSHTLEENRNQFRAALSGVLTLHKGLALGVYKLWENISYFHHGTLLRSSGNHSSHVSFKSLQTAVSAAIQ